MKLWQKIILWVFWISVLTYACVIIKDSTDVNVGLGNDRTGQGGIDIDVNRADTVRLDSIR